MGSAPELALSPLTDLTRAPIAVRSVDLGGAMPDLELGGSGDGVRYGHVAILALVGSEPVGWVSLEVPPTDRIPASMLEASLSNAVLEASHSDPFGSEPPERSTATGKLSVVITTCNAPGPLVRCVSAVLAQADDAVEVIVVENRPSGSRVREALTREFGSDSRVLYVEERRAGLAFARNAGLKVLTGDFAAFIDDDVIVGEHWVDAVHGSLSSDSEVIAVSGPILPLELETRGQVLLEQFGAFSKGFKRRRYILGMTDPPPLFPYAAGHLGSGANMAFRTQALRDIGGFDVALGAGTPARGGEDLDICVRIIRTGRALLYEPRALVWHRHPDGPQMDRQAFSYGIGLGAMLGKLLLVSPERREVLALVPRGVHYLLSNSSRKNVAIRADFPSSLRYRERAGLLLGPIAYLISRKRAARLADH